MEGNEQASIDSFGGAGSLSRAIANDIKILSVRNS
jgi:hypothetical protein